MEILRLQNVTKSFHENQVIQNLSFSVQKNSIFGFIGKNGAGKTTTMRMILGFLQPSEGEIFICGEQVRYGKMYTNRHIGYLPDVPAFYHYMDAYTYLTLCGEIAGLPKKTRLQRIPYLLDLVGLEENHKKIGTYSRGMKQRLGIAQALLHQPQLLICDEPTSALDPTGRKEILDILQSVKQETAIVFSTHILSDVEKVCDEIGILHAGTLQVTGRLEELKQKYAKKRIKIVLEDKGQVEDFLHILRNEEAYIQQIEQQKNEYMITVSDIPKSRSILLQSLLENKISIQKFEVIQPSLEQIFLEVTK